MLAEAVCGRLYLDGVEQPVGSHGLLVDRATGRKIPFARKANTDTGEWEAWATDAGGEMEQPPRLLTGKGPIDFILSRLPVLPRPKQRLLSPAEEAAEIRTIRLDYGYQELLQVPGILCDEPRCQALAAYQTGSEQEIDPGVLPDGATCERAFTRKVQRWCPRHFRNPTFTNRRGVESEVEVTVRPQ